MQANPYQPPGAKLIDESATADVELADRGQRFGAALCDGFLASLTVSVPVLFLLGTYTYIRRGQQPPWSLAAEASAIGFVVFLLLHGYYLKTAGQTIGKKLVGIRIVTLHNEVPSFTKLIVLRYLPIRLAALIPGLGSIYALIDVLLIFRNDRRCLHDWIAGTKVVKVK